MNNELDFRVGDVVCDIKYGTGNVFKIDNGFIYVTFKGINESIYEPSGKVYHGHPHRALYHGTWEQVFGNLPNLKPRRKVKRWVNLYQSGLGSVVAGSAYASEEAAISKVNPDAIAVAVEIEVDE